MKGVFTIIGVFWTTILVAQDIHFSQFEVAPMVYNPALAGVFDGDARFIANQRTQWRSVTIPYSTIGFSADVNGALERDALGAALSLYQDRAGDSRLNTFRADLAASYRIAASADSAHSFFAGLQMGVTHRAIDYSDLNYDNQWNGFAFDPNTDPNEQYTREARAHVNLNVGFAWHYREDRRNELTAGISLHHLNRPEQSFFDDPSINLDMRFSLTAFGVRQINEEWDAMGGLLLSRQGTYTEFIPGAGARYVMNESRGLFRAVFGGIYWRTRDAGYILAGVHYDDWRVGVSYDINTSDLRPASAGRGGLELSIVYILRKFEPPVIRRRLCPDYL